MDAKPLIVAYHTGGPYSEYADRLRASLDRLGLAYEIDEVASAGSWKGNCHHRPDYLQAKRLDHPSRPLLSLDADAIVHGDPLQHVRGLECDIAVHFLRNRELLPGTMYLAPTPAADDFLAVWSLQNEMRPELTDRVNCRSAWDQCKIRTVILPPEMAFIFDTSRQLYPDVEPVIEHHQASRKLRRVIDREGQEVRL